MDTSTKNQTLVYRFVDVDPEEGLDAKDLSKFLSQFDGRDCGQKVGPSGPVWSLHDIQ